MEHQEYVINTSSLSPEIFHFMFFKKQNQNSWTKWIQMYTVFLFSALAKLKDDSMVDENNVIMNSIAHSLARQSIG